MPKLYSTKCNDCGEIVSYSLKEEQGMQYCYLCILSIAEFAMLLKADRLPDKYEVYAMTHEGSSNAQKDRNKCMKLIERLNK